MNPLHKQQANPHIIEHLYRQKLITKRARERAHGLLSPETSANHWQRELDRLLLMLGAALLLTGTIFFFAYNWEHLHRLTKLSLSGAFFTLSVISTAILGWKKLSGKVSLSVAVIAIGIMLAVFGQVYQTGADEWHLFLTWSLLAIPWAFVARFQPLWLLWTVITNCALALFAFQYLDWGLSDKIALLLYAFNLGCWAIVNLISKQSPLWMTGNWLRRCYATFAILTLTLPCLRTTIEPLKQLTGADSLAFLLAWFALVGQLIIVLKQWHRKQLDLYVLATLSSSLILIVSFLVGYQIWEFTDHSSLSLLVIGFFVVVLAGLTTTAIRQLHLTYQEQTDEH